MFDWFKRLFGEGYIYSDFTCDDGTAGHGKAPYIGDPATFDRNEYINRLKLEIWYKYGKKIDNITVRLA